MPPALDRQFARATRQAPAYLGWDVDAARRLADDAGIDDVRVLSLDGDGVRLRQDHRSWRLNLLVLDGKVVRAAYF